mmetsp:Transcript_85022/g.245540  ORF Transcript_85022/g.245540 Transcript_85022/m.245540 type:complete len:85 (-) Transcript_85022:132-386(-)
MMRFQYGGPGDDLHMPGRLKGSWSLPDLGLLTLRFREDDAGRLFGARREKAAGQLFGVRYGLVAAAKTTPGNSSARGMAACVHT